MSKLKRWVALGVVFVLIMGLAGCGNGGNKMENAALAKEHVYKFQEIELPDLGGDDYSIRGSVYRDGTVYLMAQVYHWSEGSDDIDMKMLTLKDDGSDVQLMDIEIPDWRAQSEGGGNTEPDDSDEADGGQESGAEGESGGNTGAEGESAGNAGAEGESAGNAGAEGESGENAGAEGEDGEESGE